MSREWSLRVTKRNKTRLKNDSDCNQVLTIPKIKRMADRWNGIAAALEAETDDLKRAKKLSSLVKQWKSEFGSSVYEPAKQRVLEMS